MKSLNRFKLGPIKNAVEEKIASIKVQGVGSLMDVISTLKTVAEEHHIHKSSVMGLFVRRLSVCTDRLSFTAMDGLFQQFLEYIDGSEGGSDAEQDAAKLPSKLAGVELNKQITLISVNEKEGMNPKELEMFIREITKNDKTMEKMLLNLQKQQQIMCDIHDGISRKRPTSSTKDISSQVEFARFVNCLRIKDYSGAKEALVSYFDSNNTSSCCWSVYNLARLDFYFGHDDNCLNAIKECIDFSQSVNDDECLEFCLLLLAKLMIKKANEKSDMEDITALLSHLMNKGISCDLPILSTIASLHLEQIRHPLGKTVEGVIVNSPTKTTTRSTGNVVQSPQPNSSVPEVMAVRYSLDKVLPMAYANKSAHFSHFGEISLCNLTSQLLLALNGISKIARSTEHFMDNNSAIALRNIGLSIWRNHGAPDTAISLLRELSEGLFSFYSDGYSLLKKTIAVIEFEHDLFQNNFREAKTSLEKIGLFDKEEYSLGNISFLEKKGDLVGALKIADDLEESSNSFVSIRAKIARSRLLKNDRICQKCIDLIEEKNMISLRNESVLLMASLQAAQNKITESLSSLRKITVSLLSNGSLQDIGRHHLLMASNLKKMAKGNISVLQSALDYNQRGLENFARLNDVDNMKESLTLHAFLHNELGNREQRNYCSKQVILLSNGYHD